MRITNGVIQRQSLAGFQQALREMETLRGQIASGRRIRQASDDPVAASAVMRTDRGLAALDQYQRNIAEARSRVDAEDRVLDQITNLLARAKELAVAQASDTGNEATRANAAREVDGLLASVVQLGNTRFAGVYIFGGDHNDRPPFGDDGAIDPDAPPAGIHRVEIASGQLFHVNTDGQTLLVDSGVIDALKELRDSLEANNGAGVRASITSLDHAFDEIQAMVGDVGARANVLEIAEANAESWAVTLQTFRSELADVDLEEAVSRLISRQTSFQAALVANAQILQTTLTDYLR